MFKIIDPFLLVCDLRQPEGPILRVESIREGEEGRLLVVLRERDGVRSTVAGLTDILDWPVVGQQGQLPTLRRRLEETAAQVDGWLASLETGRTPLSGLLFWQKLPPAQKPPASILKRLVEHQPPETLRQWLQHDRALWTDQERAPSAPGRAITLTATARAPDADLLRHLESAYGAARLAGCLDGDLDFGGYLICALEERFVALCRETLTSLRTREQRRATPRFAVAVSLETSSTQSIEARVASDGFVLVLPFTAGTASFTARAYISLPGHPSAEVLAGRIVASAPLPLAVAAIREALVQFFDEHPSMKIRLHQGLEFATLASLDAWLTTKACSTNPNLDDALKQLGSWLDRGCLGLPPALVSQARDRVQQRTALLIRDVARDERGDHGA